MRPRPPRAPHRGGRGFFFCQSLTSYIENYIERVIYETLPLIYSIIYYYLLDVPSGRSETSLRNVDFDREKKYTLEVIYLTYFIG